MVQNNGYFLKCWKAYCAIMVSKQDFFGCAFLWTSILCFASNKKLNSPTLSVSSESFIPMLNKLDDCIAYVSSHVGIVHILHAALKDITGGFMALAPSFQFFVYFCTDFV